VNIPPFHIPFPSRISSDAAASQERSIAWARRSGLITSTADEERYRSWDLADLMARWIPEAEGHGLDITVNAVVIATILDDQFDGPLGYAPDAVAQSVSAFLDVLDPHATTGPRGPLDAAFTEIWGHLCAGKTSAWKERCAEHWRWYLNAYTEEAAIRSSRARLGVEEYLLLRYRTGLVPAMTDMIESACGFETSNRSWELPIFRRMLRLACDIIGVLNDVFSLQKEEERGDVHNFVMVLQHARQCTREEAMVSTCGLIHSWCDEFIRNEFDLWQECADRLTAAETGALRRLVSGMRDYMGSFVEWSTLSGRYTDLVPPGAPAYTSLLEPGLASGSSGRANAMRRSSDSRESIPTRHTRAE